MSELKDLINGYAQAGRIEWIGVRPDRRVAVMPMEQADIAENGLVEDRRNRPGKRAVTLIQWEHLPVIASLIGAEKTDPALLRCNIAVSGVNVLGLRSRRFRLGDAVLEGSGVCAPCSRMEEALGRGGYGALRGHGGITASVIEPGRVCIGDQVLPL